MSQAGVNINSGGTMENNKQNKAVLTLVPPICKSKPLVSYQPMRKISKPRLKVLMGIAPPLKKAA
jgi:hypothetical protein